MLAELPWILGGVLALLLRTQIPPSERRLVRLVREVLLSAPLILVYFISRGLAPERPEIADRHARHLIGLERAAGVFWEPAIQHWVGRSTLATDAFNVVYTFGHWPVIIATFLWLAWQHHDRVARYRNAMLISGSIGILIFLVYPVSPPRFMPDLGFVDTVLVRMRAYRVLQPASLSNLFAAMPSLHVGWNLLMGIAVFREARHPAARAFGALMPLAMSFAVVATGNHYIVDAIAGAAIVTASLALTDLLADRAAARRPLPPTGTTPHGSVA